MLRVRRFAGAGRWAELAAAHDRFVEDYNAQPYLAHRDRPGGRRSPPEVLGFLGGEVPRGGDEPSLAHERVRATLGYLGYASFRRLHGEEALAGREAALCLAAESVTPEHAGEPLPRYEARVEAGTGEPRPAGRPGRNRGSSGWTPAARPAG